MSLAETGKRLLMAGTVLAFAMNWGVCFQVTYMIFFTNIHRMKYLVLFLSDPFPILPIRMYGIMNGALQQAWERRGIEILLCNMG